MFFSPRSRLTVPCSDVRFCPVRDECGFVPLITLSTARAPVDRQGVAVRVHEGKLTTEGAILGPLREGDACRLE